MSNVIKDFRELKVLNWDYLHLKKNQHCERQYRGKYS